MLSSEEKRQLENRFFLEDFVPDELESEELEYWDMLTSQWNQSLLCVYERIVQQDQHMKNKL